MATKAVVDAGSWVNPQSLLRPPRRTVEAEGSRREPRHEWNGVAVRADVARIDWEGTVSGPLETAARQFTASLDALDVAAMVGVLADDVEGVEEISRQWLRGRDAVARYMRELATQVSDIRTTLRDVNERVWGEVGVVTCWLDQTYTFEGESVGISAPTTLLFRNDAGGWKLTLFHSVPFPEQE
jgi:ketosteroid isomerase-like protein